VSFGGNSGIMGSGIMVVVHAFLEFERIAIFIFISVFDCFESLASMVDVGIKLKVSRIN